MSVFVTSDGNEELEKGVLLRIYASNFLPTAVSGEVPAPAVIALTITGARATTRSTAAIQRIDEHHANPFALWQSWGAGGAPVTPRTDGPWYMNSSQVQLLVDASKLVTEELQTSTLPSGEQMVSFDLPPHPVARIDFLLLEGSAATFV